MLTLGKSDPLAGVSIGDPFMGGYFAGIIDSTQAGSIPGADYYSTGQRYALIDLGKSYESSSYVYKTSNTAAPAQCSTVWNGLGATQAMASAGSAYQAATYANGVSVPADGASSAYIPAMWEMLAMFWYLKQFTNNNYTTDVTGATFPFSPVVQGVCPIADPQRSAFTTAVPGQTSLSAWKSGGAQAFADNYFWTATESSTGAAWQFGWVSSAPGYMNFGASKSASSRSVRLVRRLVL